MPDRPGFEDTQVQAIFFFTNDAAAINLDKALVIDSKDTFFTRGLIFLEQGPLGRACVVADVFLSVIIHPRAILTQWAVK